MAPISLVSTLPVYSGVNTCKQNGCHVPLLSNYSSTSKCLLVRKCDVALKRYRTCNAEIAFALIGTQFACGYFFDSIKILAGKRSVDSARNN